MKRFIEGDNRQQITLLPESLDEYIDAENPVRIVDLFVDQLDLGGLGFSVEPAATGRPSYHSSTLLKLYVYGYLNRIQSSRRLERETQRNIELMWLLGRLSPDFKTIADFRRDNGEGIRNACRQFVVLCRQLNLFAQAGVAIDGSKFKAVNAHDRNFTQGKLEKRMQEIDRCIERYLTEMDTADRQPADIAEARTTRLKEKLTTLTARMVQLQEIQSQLDQSPTGQISLTDPDARAMATSTSRGMVGYNVQTSVDTKHHLIVAHEVTNEGYDRRQPSNMALKSREAIGTEQLDVLADRGYFKGPEILKCVEAGITPWVPKTMTSDNKAKGLFDKRDFIYIEANNEYRCPAGEHLIYRFSSSEDGMKINHYFASSLTCRQCDQKAQCTTGKERRVRRWEHEGVLDAMKHRMNSTPGKMKQRRCTVEHVFGTLKFWMGSAHFLMRRLKNVKTEMSLHVLSYNLRRVINLLGADELMAAIRRYVAAT